MNTYAPSQAPGGGISHPALSLPAFWSRFRDEAPFVHPEDRPVLERSPHGKWLASAPGEDFHAFLRTDHLGVGQERFYFSLLPVPYAGDLQRADIFILLLNPGFGGACEFYAEYRRPEWRDRVLKNLMQDQDGFEFPNLNLDPEFCWNGGFSWWERKLRGIGKALAPCFGGYRGALRELSRRVACIELVPYHSSAFGWHKLFDDLPSTAAARGFVREVLLPRARRDEISLIVTRQVRTWGLTQADGVGGVVVYGSGMTRAAGLGPETPGGREILRRLAR